MDEKNLNSDEEEYDDNDNVELDKDSGLKNYFKEIVKNANKYGEKIDLT